MDDLKRILYEVQGNHIVFLDGVTENNINEEILGKGWLLNDREQRKLVVVSSLVCRWKAKPEDDEMLNLREHFISSWTLDEYFKAVEDNELFQAVKPQLDASNELDPAVVFRSASASNTDDDTPAKADHIALWRQEQVKSKYYFAGGSVLHVFGCSTARVVASLDIAAKVISKANATHTLDGRSDDAIYQLYRYRGCDAGFISQYARSAITMFGGPTLIKSIAFDLTDDLEAAKDGRMLEMYFFARICRGGVTLYDGANEIRLPEGKVHILNPLDTTELPAG
ncbi:hypothetical protein V7S43_000140 [Phytophthora oleae]|uniref:Carbonic anhydrase n=1 Tax=Phytophthora oleae TaxID=2107226 RepID=A0ABD3G835_9STRA